MLLQELRHRELAADLSLPWSRTPARSTWQRDKASLEVPRCAETMAQEGKQWEQGLYGACTPRGSLSLELGAPELWSGKSSFTLLFEILEHSLPLFAVDTSLGWVDRDIASCSVQLPEDGASPRSHSQLQSWV